MPDPLAHAIADVLKAGRTTLLDAIEARVCADVAEAGTSACLTVIGRDATRQVTFAPSATGLRNYAPTLWAFVRGKRHDGLELDSALSPLIAEAVQVALAATLGEMVKGALPRLLPVLLDEPALRDAIARCLGDELPDNGLFTDVRRNVTLEVQRLVMDAANDPTLLDEVLDTVSEVALGTTVSLVGAVGGAAATNAIGTIIVSAVSAKVAVIVMHSLAGIGIKGLVGMLGKKAAVAALSATLLTGMSAWIMPALIPVLIGYLAWEVRRLPSKLSATLAPKVRGALDENFSDMSERLAAEMSKAMREEASSALSHLAPASSTRPG